MRYALILIGLATFGVLCYYYMIFVFAVYDYARGQRREIAAGRPRQPGETVWATARRFMKAGKEA